MNTFRSSNKASFFSHHLPKMEVSTWKKIQSTDQKMITNMVLTKTSNNKIMNDENIYMILIVKKLVRIVSNAISFERPWEMSEHGDVDYYAS